uniref:Uncharacterized protein n=1 Tax=Panagrolaimus superbus TaxID=310955 RepID=A0A914YI21_9BILA
MLNFFYPTPPERDVALEIGEEEDDPRPDDNQLGVELPVRIVPDQFRVYQVAAAALVVIAATQIAMAMAYFIR